jgi:hypothetical protein
MLLFISRTSSTIDAELSEDASMAAGTEKVGLGDWKSARLTWALASTTATRAVVLANWEEVGLADSGQAAISTANFKVGLVDSE